MKVYDKDIRKLLLKEIASNKKYYSDPLTIIIHEMDVCFGCARVDIAVINDEIHGYEIKSSQDNLERLPSQIEFYNEVFDTLTLAVSEIHYSRASEIVPEWWGLYCITQQAGKLSIEERRPPKQNDNISTFRITQLLWKEELFQLLKENGITKGIKSKTRFELGKIVVDNINKGEVAQFVRMKLKDRKPWKALQLQQLCDDLHLLLPN